MSILPQINVGKVISPLVNGAIKAVLPKGDIRDKIVAPAVTGLVTGENPVQSVIRANIPRNAGVTIPTAPGVTISGIDLGAIDLNGQNQQGQNLGVNLAIDLNNLDAFSNGLPFSQRPDGVSYDDPHFVTTKSSDGSANIFNFNYLQGHEYLFIGQDENTYAEVLAGRWGRSMNANGQVYDGSSNNDMKIHFTSAQGAHQFFWDVETGALTLDGQPLTQGQAIQTDSTIAGQNTKATAVVYVENDPNDPNFGKTVADIDLGNKGIKFRLIREKTTDDKGQPLWYTNAITITDDVETQLGGILGDAKDKDDFRVQDFNLDVNNNGTSDEAEFLARYGYSAENVIALALLKELGEKAKIKVDRSHDKNNSSQSIDTETWRNATVAQSGTQAAAQNTTQTATQAANATQNNAQTATNTATNTATQANPVVTTAAKPINTNAINTNTLRTANLTAPAITLTATATVNSTAAVTTATVNPTVTATVNNTSTSTVATLNGARPLGTPITITRPIGVMNGTTATMANGTIATLANGTVATVTSIPSTGVQTVNPTTTTITPPINPINQTGVATANTIATINNNPGVTVTPPVTTVTTPVASVSPTVASLAGTRPMPTRPVASVNATSLNAPSAIVSDATVTMANVSGIKTNAAVLRSVKVKT